MPVEFICEGCGKRAPGIFMYGRWYKPHNWYERGWDEMQVACSRECIEKVAKATGKTNLVTPI